MAYGKENFIGSWSIDKLRFLERYLPQFAIATKKALHRYYIDGFGGQGTWLSRETGMPVEGSASIALKQIDKYSHLFFIEKNPDRATKLNQLITAYGAQQKATVFIGDCNTEMSKVLARIHPKAPTFVFLDPSGDHLKWSTIDLLSKWRTELFLLFPYNMTLIRYLPRHRKQEEWQKEHLDAFFGTRDWEEIYRGERIYLLRRLLDLYTGRLRSLGYKHVNISECFKSSTGQKLYYMIWVGKHDAGKKIMDWVFAQQSNQLTLF